MKSCLDDKAQQEHCDLSKRYNNRLETNQLIKPAAIRMIACPFHRWKSLNS